MILLYSKEADDMIGNFMLLAVSIIFFSIIFLVILYKSVDQKRLAITNLSGSLLFMAIVAVIVFWAKVYGTP